MKDNLRVISLGAMFFIFFSWLFGTVVDDVLKTIRERIRSWRDRKNYWED